MKISSSLSHLTLLGIALLPGCRAKTSLPGAGNSEPIIVPVVPAPMPQSPVQVTASANKTQFAVGEAVELSIEIKNISNAAVDLNFSSGQKFDFSATREGEKAAIWSYGMNKRFIQSLSTVSLEAGKSLNYSTTWPNAAAGKYTVEALIKANGGMKAAPFQVVVK